MNLADNLSRQAKLQPSGVAVISGSGVISFRELDLLVWRLAALLREQGVAPGDVVGLSIVDELPHLVASIALIRMGAVQVALPPVDPRAVRNETAQRTGVSVLLTGGGPPTGIGLPALAVDFQKLQRDRSPVDEGVRSGDLSRTFLLSIGSGTTGRPKVVPCTADQHLKQCRTGAGASQIRAGERVLITASVNFGSGKRRRLECVWAGATNVFRRGDQDLFTVCDLADVRHVHLAASHAVTIFQNREAEWPGLRFPHMKSLSLGSSVVSESLRALLRTRVTPNVVVVYATNETGPVAFATAEMQARHPGAVGRPAPGVEIEVVNEDGRVLPAGEVGEIRIRSPGMISGYHDDPEATAAVFRDGWFYPRDLGAFTDDGVLIFHGRADDMMILDGINIFPREIELTLESHPRVREAVAFPVPHPVHKDLPAALVVLSGASSEAELISFCRERIGVRAPCRITILPEIPEQFRGKVMRRDFFPLLREAGL